MMRNIQETVSNVSRHRQRNNSFLKVRDRNAREQRKVLMDLPRRRMRMSLVLIYSIMCCDNFDFALQY